MGIFLKKYRLLQICSELNVEKIEAEKTKLDRFFHP